MMHISCYDIEGEYLEKLADKYDTTEPELIEAIVEILKSGEVDLKDWL